MNNSSLFCKSLGNGSLKKKSYWGWETPWKYPLVLFCPTLLSVQGLQSQNVFLRTMRPSAQFSTKNHGELLPAAPAAQHILLLQGLAASKAGLQAPRLASPCPGHPLREALVLFPWEGRGCSSLCWSSLSFCMTRFCESPGASHGTRDSRASGNARS